MTKSQQLVDLICSKVEKHPEKVKVSEGFGDNNYMVTYEGVDCKMILSYNSFVIFPNFHIKDISLEDNCKYKLYNLMIPFIKVFMSQNEDDKLEEMITMWED